MTTPDPHPASARDPAGERSIPVIEEDLQVARTRETRGVVRVRIETEEVAQPIDLDQWHEHYDVERVAIDQPAAERLPPRQEGEAWIVPVYEERVVVSRQLVLKEEIRLHRRHLHEPRSAEVVLRKQHARVEREDGGSQSQADEASPARADGPVFTTSKGARE